MICQLISTTLHVVTSQTIDIFIVIVFRTSDLVFVMLITDAKQVSRLSETSMNV